MPSTAGYALTGKKMPKRSPETSDNGISCGQWDEICPREAIKVVNSKANVDYSICIRCYCCHEVCPENAISLEVLK